MEFKQLFYGGDYNPEQWPEEVWLEDVRLMQEAGVNLVSLGIFSWVKLEPASGEFDFAWLDRIIDLLHKNGIAVNLATPTAVPPAWMIKQHPSILPLTEDGQTLWHGSRRHYCPHSPDYHRYAQRIAKALAEHYKNHAALTMWHVDNEYACHFGECYCENSVAAFREWLKKRYQTLDQLNTAWGTAFWGQIYGDWEEIQAPRKTPAQKNPTQDLDWARFNSDSWLACFEEQKNILREITPEIPITTNFMSFHRPIDYFKFAKSEDVVSLDNYPDPSDPNWMVQSAITYDLIRSLKKDTPWILMEQAASQVNWRQRNAVKRPGQMRLGSMQAVARGADGIMFFQWRQSKAGGEKFHSAMLPHGGTNTRTWREVKTLGNELSLIKNLLSSKVEAKVALLMDWENWWAVELDSKPSSDLKLLPNIYQFYEVLFNQHIPVDFAAPQEDLSSYDFVIAPNLYLVSDAAVENIKTYVKNGGTLLLTYFSGIVDENDQIRLGGYPAPFQDMLGLWIEEHIPYQNEMDNIVKTEDGLTFTNTMWAELIHLLGAQPLAIYTEDYYQGRPAFTRHNYGSGTAFYLSTELEPQGLFWIINRIIIETGLQPVVNDLPDGVEVMQRTDGQKFWLFILNHNNVDMEIKIEKPGIDLLSGQMIYSHITLPAFGVSVIKTVNEE